MLLCIRAWLPTEHAELLHDCLAEITEEAWRTIGDAQPAKPVSIDRRLCGWRASKHPHPSAGRNELVHQLPTLGLYVLIGVCFVNHNQVELAVVQHVVSNGGYAVVVDDDELSGTADNLRPLVGIAVGYVNCAVHCELKQISLPCGLHD